MEYISCAEFVERSKGNTRCIPETDGAVLMSVNLKQNTDDREIRDN